MCMLFSGGVGALNILLFSVSLCYNVVVPKIYISLG